MIFTKAFILDALERAVKTFAQALLAVIGAEVVTPLHANWSQTFVTAGFAAFVSALTSIVSAGAVARAVSPASAVPASVAGEPDHDRGQVDVVTLLVIVLIVVLIIVLVNRL